MPIIHLTAATVEQIKPPESGQVLIWDDEMKGFGLRVTRGNTAAGKKVFIAETRVKGKTRRVKIGDYPFPTPEEARREAKIKIGEMVGGADHNAEKAAQRAKTITLQGVLDDYCQVKRDLRPRTKEIYQDAMDRCFADWKDKQIVDITRAMVRDRYGRTISKVAESSGKRQYKGELINAYAQLAVQLRRK